MEADKEILVRVLLIETSALISSFAAYNIFKLLSILLLIASMALTAFLDEYFLKSCTSFIFPFLASTKSIVDSETNASTYPFSPVPYEVPVFPLALFYSFFSVILFSAFYILALFVKIR